MSPPNPTMITLARESRGWKVKHLASAIGVHHSTVSRYELGTAPISGDQVKSIAQALNFHEDFFYLRTPAVGLGGDFLYRKRARLSAFDRKRVEAEANIRWLQVEQLLKGFIEYERFPFPAIDLEEVNGRPDRAAVAVREAWRVSRGPIGNLTNLIEREGGIVFLIDFGTDLIDGTNIRLPGCAPILFLNNNVSGERHRWNLAHELAHVVMHFSVSLGDAEDEANEFAQEFLMPRSQIKQDLRNLDLAAALRLKQFWGVSMAAIIMRAKSLGVISESRTRKLFTAMNARGLRTREPQPLEMERPKVFESMTTALVEQLRLASDDLYRVLFTDRLGSIPAPEARRDAQLRFTGFDLEG